ncbi:unnamed protein product [Callosobruchus maculatus]|uniref:Uncharacterized protein n=1 Tax=Callosobruchus maculatus TaxID=64391 RepID=A0A653CGC3_CALMS|nr:unnamed protein product [Callosobruchus maculatus]
MNKMLSNNSMCNSVIQNIFKHVSWFFLTTMIPTKDHSSVQENWFSSIGSNIYSLTCESQFPIP